MKACPNCKKKINEKDYFCQMCGYDLHTVKGEVDALRQEPKKKNGCLLVLLWFFFFPIMLLYTLFATKRIGKIPKIILALLLVGCCVFGAKNSESGKQLDVGSTIETGNSVVAKTEKRIKVETISSFEEVEYIKEIGEEVEFFIYITPKKIAREDIVIENSNSDVVQVLETSFKKVGNAVQLQLSVIAVSKGEAELQIQSVDGEVESNKVKFIVEEPCRITQMSRFRSTKETLEVGDSYSYTLQILPEGISREDLVVQIGDSNILDFTEDSYYNENGKTIFEFTVTAIAEGETDLQIVSYDGKRETGTVCFTLNPRDTSGTVYTTPTGERYHYSSKCAGKNARATTLNKAKKAGYTPCKKCAQ